MFLVAQPPLVKTREEDTKKIVYPGQQNIEHGDVVINDY